MRLSVSRFTHEAQRLARRIDPAARDVGRREIGLPDHHERNHQGMNNRLLFPATRTAHGDRPMACRPRLGGLLKSLPPHCRIERTRGRT